MLSPGVHITMAPDLNELLPLIQISIAFKKPFHVHTIIVLDVGISLRVPILRFRHVYLRQLQLVFVSLRVPCILSLVVAHRS